ncbi:hypothetical protein [Piscirickettsia litoralis]|uniref:Uncharacterized protein n=1 Tax=Piscirickettsia litoralis TaxID=1891921 RepID=A0ABX3A0U8_9GAMM|nr:hypothetical protein [Piscirickettsia litoralis]ODN41030.1 hypothetical protein BGC07_18540 [Piscirickettsia litoralis]
MWKKVIKKLSSWIFHVLRGIALKKIIASTKGTQYRWNKTQYDHVTRQHVIHYTTGHARVTKKAYANVIQAQPDFIKGFNHTDSQLIHWYSGYDKGYQKGRAEGILEGWNLLATTLQTKKTKKSTKLKMTRRRNRIKKENNESNS